MRGRFALLVLLNSFVGGMVGLERTVLPLLAEAEFGIASSAAAFSFIATFGLAKATMNAFAGHLADRFGRRRVLVAGWLVGVPVPVLLLVAPAWSWVVAANVLLGVNQALAWSMTVNMKLDLVGPRRRGLATGLNEAAGYLGLAAVALATGLLAARYGLRPAPFVLGVVLALAGLALALLVRETRPAAPRAERPWRALGAGFRIGTWGDRRLAAASFAGLATNLKDGALWGLLPGVVLARGLDLESAALVVAAYPAAWGLLQAAAGPASDRFGRLPFVVGGLALQAAGVVALALAHGLAALLAAAIATGVGTALAYPTLLARVSDLAPDAARATLLGVFRTWRDLGYFVGAVGAGWAADALGVLPAFLGIVVALLVAAAAVGAGRASPAP